MDKNYLLNQIVDSISITENEMERIKNKIQTLINEIAANFNLKTITHTYIGSYAFKTVVNYNDEEIDIDCMLLFSQETIEKYNIRIELEKILNKYTNKLIRDAEVVSKEKVIQVKFYFNDEKNNYHIDFPITYDYNDKRYLILENQYYEITEAHKIVNEFNKVFDNNADKLKFHRNVIKLFKRWVKTNIKYDIEKIPSIAILQSCILINNNNCNDILTNLKNNASYIYQQLNKNNEFKLKWEPHNDIFYKKDKELVLKKLDIFWNHMTELEKIDDEKKFIKTARKFFLGENDKEDSLYGDKTSGA